MMIKVSGGFIDFDGDVDVERQVKLFENIDETWGDFSYSFELAKTSNNIRLLGNPSPDNISKPVYQRIDAELMNDAGEAVYKGYLRIERVANIIQCSFFSGNNNWMGLLSGALIEMDLDEYDQPLTEANIISRFSATEGIIFPIIDTGTLVTRSHPTLKIEDFTAGFYLHTLFKEIFNKSGLKVNGELLEDALFNKIVLVSNTRSSVEAERNSVYVAAGPGQVFNGASSVQWNLLTNPYHVGSNVTIFGSNTGFEANVDMIIDVQASYKTSGGVWASLLIAGGVSPVLLDFKIGDENSLESRNVKIQAGTRVALSLNTLFGGDRTLESATLRIIPKFIYKAFGSSTVPNWTKLELVSNVLSAFNVITDFDHTTKTVTCNLFDKIKSKPQIDISEYVTVAETDFASFIDAYGKRTLISYSEGDDEDLRLYNIATFNKYGSGVIQVNNDFLPDEADIVQLDFASPISYVNPTLGMSLEKLGYLEHEESDAMDITSVTDSSGTPRFNVDESDTDVEDVFKVNDLVRVDSNVVAYNGDYVIQEVNTAGYLVIRGLTFDATATGTISKLQPKLTTTDSAYMMVNTGIRPVSDLSTSLSSIWIEGNEYTNATLAFFNLINTGAPINPDFKQGLSFGEIADPLFYQRTLTERYFGTVRRILNDPVKLIVEAYLPGRVYKLLTPFFPVTIRTEETTNVYYINKITGYKESHLPCTIELIKLP